MVGSGGGRRWSRLGDLGHRRLVLFQGRDCGLANAACSSIMWNHPKIRGSPYLGGDAILNVPCSGSVARGPGVATLRRGACGMKACDGGQGLVVPLGPRDGSGCHAASKALSSGGGCS